MGRKILSVVAGLAAAILFFLIGEQVNAALHPSPADLDFKNLEAVKSFYNNQPISLWLQVLVVWAIGSAICGLLIKIISMSDKKSLPIIAGCILTLSGIANFFSLPHPTWFIIVGLLVFIPFVLIGFNLYKLKTNTDGQKSII